jgi:hypothetical protein
VLFFALRLREHGYSSSDNEETIRHVSAEIRYTFLPVVLGPCGERGRTQSNAEHEEQVPNPGFGYRFSKGDTIRGKMKN